MSDFFSALAARSLGAAPSLAPRPASRFEAPAAPAEPVEAPFAAAESFEAPAGPRMQAPAPDPRPALVPPPPAPRIAPEPRSIGSDDIDPTRSPRRSSDEEDRGAARPSIEPSAGPPIRPSIEPIGERRIDPMPRDADRPSRAESPIVPTSSETIRPRADAPRLPDPAEPERIAPVRPGREDAVAPIQPMTIPAAVRKEGGDAPLPIIVPRAEPLPPVATPRLAAAPVSSASSDGAAEPAAPVIRVSIGRIEVRAAQPAPATPPQPRAGGAPRLSLDDYLRSGARRRP